MLLKSLKKRRGIVVFTFCLSLFLQHLLPLGRILILASIVLSLGTLMWFDTYEKDINKNGEFIGCFHGGGLAIVALMYSLVSAIMYLFTCIFFNDYAVCIRGFNGILIGNIGVLVFLGIWGIYSTREKSNQQTQ